jgi:hypothetical protein
MMALELAAGVRRQKTDWWRDALELVLMSC